MPTASDKVGSQKIQMALQKLKDGDIELSENLAKAVQQDWFGLVHPFLGQARIKQIPPSWYSTEELNKDEQKIFDMWLDGNMRKEIAGIQKRPVKEVKKDLKMIEIKLRYSLEPKKGNWQNLIWLMGRGAGKTRSGAEIVKEYVRRGWATRVALVSPTPKKARDDLLRKKNSGLLKIYPEGKAPDYKPTKTRLEWKNGAEANIYSGANPEALRGPEFDLAWVDELAAFKYPQDT